MSRHAEQIDSAFRCDTCKGEGTVVLRDPNCHHGGNNCPCGTSDEKCPDCYDGVEPCHFCGDHPAAHVVPDPDFPMRPDKLCESCFERHAWTACSICDRKFDQPTTNPLCGRCEATAKAHGQLLTDASRYPDPEHERVA